MKKIKLLVGINAAIASAGIFPISLSSCSCGSTDGGDPIKDKYEVWATGEGLTYYCSKNAICGEDYKGTYELDNKYEILTKTIICGDEDITNKTGVIFNSGRIFIPGEYVKNCIHIKASTILEAKIPRNISGPSKESFSGTAIHEGSATISLKFYNSASEAIEIPEGSKATWKILSTEIYGESVTGQMTASMTDSILNVVGAIRNDTQFLVTGSYILGNVQINYFQFENESEPTWTQTLTLKIGYLI